MLADFTERLDAAIGRRPGRWLAVLSAVFLAITIVRAGTTPFLPDEVVTVWTSALPSHAGLRAALEDGLDSQPPLYPVVLRVLHSPVGEGWFITRLPAIAGFWIAAVTVFVLVRRRASALLALTAALLLFFTAADRHAIEARGAVPAMACVVIACYAWVEAAAGRTRILHSALLAAALAAGIWWDYFAALALLPLAAGEWVRWRTSRWRDVRWRAAQPPNWPIPTAVALAAAAALPLVPLAGPALAARAPAAAGAPR
jgi:hypothetical protein